MDNLGHSFAAVPQQNEKHIRMSVKYLGCVFQLPGVVYSMCYSEAHILSLCDEGLDTSI